MRLWSLHPKYLDPQGLVALWREALLAQAVLAGETKGYRNHPQLERFRGGARPAALIAEYLRAVHAESIKRGYRFDKDKIGRLRTSKRLDVTSGQIDFEWRHLMKKLKTRSPEQYEKLLAENTPLPHPLFRVTPGEIADWERL
ncbi:MAG: pyrimidine dimer DNA glycosylase/endonuclease V [Nitrospinae bacterium]|nr:pyrimidine dimer DNA glycosylase/endonuclease V [Nitrospinota bacterium]